MNTRQVIIVKEVFAKIKDEMDESNKWVDRGYESLEPPKVVPTIHHWIDKYFKDMKYRIEELEKLYLTGYTETGEGVK